MSNPVFTLHVRGGLAVVLLTITGLLGYTVHQHYQVKQISAQNDQVISSLNDTRAQMAALAAKIDSLNAPPAAQPTPVKAPLAAASRPHPRPAARYNANDVRIRHLQTQVDAQGRAIDSTRQE